MNDAKSTTKTLRPIAYISGILLIVVFVVYFFNRPHEDYNPAIITGQPSASWSQTIEVNTGDEEPLPPLIQYPTHYHITTNKPIYVTSSHTQRKQKIGSGEIVCLMQYSWKNKEEAMITVEGIEKQTTVKLAIFNQHTTSKMSGQSKLQNRQQPPANDHGSSNISTIEEQLLGKWVGEVGGKPAVLIFSKQNESIQGTIIYDGFEEVLLVNYRNNREDLNADEIPLVLEGVSFKRLKGRGNFSLDTFFSTLKLGSNELSGNYQDRAGRTGKWFVSKKVTVSIHAPKNSNPSIRIRNMLGVAYSYTKKAWAVDPGFGSWDKSRVNLLFHSGLVYGYGSIRWNSSFGLISDQLCAKILKLHVDKDGHLPEFYSDIGVGYMVRLENAVFADYTISRAVMLFRTFGGDSPPPLIQKCFEIKSVFTSKEHPHLLVGQWKGSYNERNANGSLSSTGFMARFRQNRSSFDGAILESATSQNGQTRKRSSVEGFIIDNRITFVKVYEQDVFGVSYVSSPIQDTLSIEGTWYAGFQQGSWKMDYVGDYEGSMDDILSLELPNPPEKKH